MAVVAPTSAVAFMLQATPWVPLVVRRGTTSDVSVKIPLEEDDDDVMDAGHTSSFSASAKDGKCLVWQFRVEEFDVGFQILENGRPLNELTRHTPTTATPTDSTPDPTAPQRTQHDSPTVTAEGTQAIAHRGDVYTFRWDNSYSFVRHKRVFYRFVVTSKRAFDAAQTAATETERRCATQLKTDASVASVKPHLAKRLALERRLTVDEVSLEQTRAIEHLQRCVTDLVSAFMTDPDRPLHEGNVREFVLALESVLRNGIKEEYLRLWPEEPYFEFLLQIQHVLRYDKGLIAEVKAHSTTNKLRYLGWTRSRALLLSALNKNMVHYAFENLIKRRTVVEKYYSSHGLMFMYSSATQIVSFLSALNGVKFLLEPVPDESYLEGTELPPNLAQCAPDDEFDGEQVVFQGGDTLGSGYVVRNPTSEDADEMKRIDQCSVARGLLASHHPMREATIPRGTDARFEVDTPSKRPLLLAVQLRVVPGDIVVSVLTSADATDLLIEPITIAFTDGWVDLMIVVPGHVEASIALCLTNSNAMVRARQVEFRCRAVSHVEFDSAWEACQGVAQSISWKAAARAGAVRCENFMKHQLIQEHQEVVDRQRSREASGTSDHDGESLDDDSLFNRGASLITKPVSYLVGGFLGVDSDGASSSCAQCLAPFSFFSRQCVCLSCQCIVCTPCSRHTAQINGKGPQVRLCDRCFIKEKDAERKRRGVDSNAANSGGECAAYAALREDPSMEKYFKMLSFGVPHSGVAQKMLQDEMPSDKISIFSAGPRGGVGDVDGAESRPRRDSSVVPSGGPGSSRGSSFRKLHWTSLESKRASSSIWNRETSRRKMAPIRLSPQDIEEAVRLFSATSTSSSTPKSQSGGSTKRIFSALDSRRSNNINIGLSQFKSVGGVDAILSSLKNCDLDFLSADRLGTLYDVAPTAIEAKRYTNFRGSRSRLEPAEKFLIEMCEIPRVTEKIAAMRFVAQFDSQYRELQHRTRCITEACAQIQQSERLARCFELILAIGNLLNTGSEMANSDGVTLESLLKLSETKSVDQSMTLLHFIVRVIHDRGEGDVLLFLQELDGIAAAKRFSNVTCTSQAKILQTGVNLVQTEMKEEMLIDVRNFEKAEEKRRAQFEQQRTIATAHLRPSQSLPASETATGDKPQDPRAVLMATIQKRNATAPNGSKQDNSVAPNSRAALLAAIRKPRADEDGGKPAEQTASPSPGIQPPRSALLASIRERAPKGETSGTSSEATATTEPPVNPRGALLAAIRSPSPAAGTSQAPRPGLPPRGDLLASIRSRKPREGSEASKASPGDSTASANGAPFVPRVYSVNENQFITVLRERVLMIKAQTEELELALETMVSAWESTARYLGEDPSTSSSEYALHLLNRFILDVKIAKSLLSRQGLTFHSSLPMAQVGSVVATVHGPGVVTAIRREATTKLEVQFPWSREAYLSPVAVLRVGALVRVRAFGIGILRSTHYDRGHCCVRFGWGFGIVRVGDLAPVSSSSTSHRLKDAVLAGGFRVGDPVVTPFGCGSVRFVGGKDSQWSDSLAVSVSPDGGESRELCVAGGPIAYVQRCDVKLQYYS